MDEIDRAQAIEEEFQADALKRQLGRSRSLIPGPQSLTHCEECEEPIPERRRELIPGCRLCVVCQTENERAKNAGL